MTREVIAVPPELPLRRAWDLMVGRRIRHLPVMQGTELLGIVSDRDLLARGTSVDRGALELPDGEIAEVMTPDPFTAATSTTVSDLARLMVSKKIDAVPIVDPRGRLIGLVTSTDLLELLIVPDEVKLLPFDFQLQTATALGEVRASAQPESLKRREARR